MKAENAIEVHNLTKSFRVYYDKGRTLKEKLLFSKRRKYEERKVLRGINFEVQKGEAIGLIGHNGCGKSTTLKLLTKIMYPDSGIIEMKGRVSSLIELGAGFHPDMSGRENIYINAAIFGLTRKEIDARLDDIIAFSELEEFIDNPVRTYSSGMYMRLAFSVAISVNADILLIDEILAVGDTNFQAKCFDKLRELKASGLTIVIVSHDTGTIERFCNKAVWINDGMVVKKGNAPAVVDAYLNYMNGKKVEQLIKQEEKTTADNVDKEQEKTSTIVGDGGEENEEIDYSANRFGLKKIEIEKAVIRNDKGEKTSVLKARKDCSIEIFYKVNMALKEYVFGIGIYTLDGVCLYGCNTQLDRMRISHNSMNGRISCEIEDLPLLTGKYILNVAIVDVNGVPMDFYRDYCHFDVVSEERNVGYVSLKHAWKEE